MLPDRIRKRPRARHKKDPAVPDKIPSRQKLLRRMLDPAFPGTASPGGPPTPSIISARSPPARCTHTPSPPASAAPPAPQCSRPAAASLQSPSASTSANRGLVPSPHGPTETLPSTVFGLRLLQQKRPSAHTPAPYCACRRLAQDMFRPSPSAADAEIVLIQPPVRHHPDIFSLRHRQQPGAASAESSCCSPSSAQHLLRPSPPAPWPEPRPTSTRQNHWRKPHIRTVSHITSILAQSGPHHISTTLTSLARKPPKPLLHPASPLHQSRHALTA